MNDGVSFVSHMRQFDAYPKILEDFRVKTVSGAVVTAICSLIMFFLFISEFDYYQSTDVKPELLVDTTRPEKLQINIDVLFPFVGCSYLHLEAIDISGHHQTDLEHSVFKQRYDEQGNPIDLGEQKDVNNATAEKAKSDSSESSIKGPSLSKSVSVCGNCYGAETEAQPCCETCADIKKAYFNKGWPFHEIGHMKQCQEDNEVKLVDDPFEHQKGEGCRIRGSLEVSKAAGKFHITADKRLNGMQGGPNMLFQFVNIAMSFDNLFGLGNRRHNMSHHIKHLSFGAPIPGVVNPLDGTNVSAEADSIMYQYFVKIVPTVYKKVSGDEVWSNQYSFTKHNKNVEGMSMSPDHGPGFFVRYELSPLLVQYTEKRRSLTQFLTSLCAIIGGLFTVAGLIDSFIYRSTKVLKKNIDCS